MHIRSSALCVLLFAFAAFAQNNPGSLTGTVVEGNRAAVAGAPVQVKNAETGTVYRATSSPKGEYTIANLPPGNYELSVSMGGFNPYRREVVIQASQAQRVDISIGDFITLDTLGEDRATFGILFKRSAPPAGPAPRLPGGKPDLSGLWSNPLPTNPNEVETPEMLPWAEAVTKERIANNLKDAPSTRCLPASIGLMGGFLNTRLVHSPEILVSIIDLDIPGYRQVFLDGREHPKDLEPTWQGHSIGRWDGDTLVVETVGFNDKTWLGNEGNPHTEKLRLTTRLRRMDLGHLEVEVTFEDPGAFKKPWKVKGVATLSINKNDEVQEYICTENNQDVPHLIGK